MVEESYQWYILLYCYDFYRVTLKILNEYLKYFVSGAALFLKINIFFSPLSGEGEEPMTALDAERLAQGEIKQNNYLPFKTRNTCMSNSVDFKSKNAKALLWGTCMPLVCIIFKTIGFTYWGEIHVPVSLLLLYLHLSSLPSQFKPHSWINHASNFQP